MDDTLVCRSVELYPSARFEMSGVNLFDQNRISQWATKRPFEKWRTPLSCHFGEGTRDPSTGSEETVVSRADEESSHNIVHAVTATFGTWFVDAHMCLHEP